MFFWDGFVLFQQGDERAGGRGVRWTSRAVSRGGGEGEGGPLVR